MNNSTLIIEFTKRSFEEKFSTVSSMVKAFSQKNDNFASIHYSLQTTKPSESFLTVIYTEIIALYTHKKDIETAQNIKKYESLSKASLNEKKKLKKDRATEQKQADSLLLSL